MIWQHAWHAAKHSYVMDVHRPNEQSTPDLPIYGTVSFGSYLHADLPNDYKVVIGVLPEPETYEGHRRSLGAMMRERFGETPVLLDLSDPEAGFLPINSPGLLWENANKLYLDNVRLARQCDAVFYIPKSRSTKVV